MMRGIEEYGAGASLFSTGLAGIREAVSGVGAKRGRSFTVDEQSVSAQSSHDTDLVAADFGRARWPLVRDSQEQAYLDAGRRAGRAVDNAFLGDSASLIPALAAAGQSGAMPVQNVAGEGTKAGLAARNISAEQENDGSDKTAPSLSSISGTERRSPERSFMGGTSEAKDTSENGKETKDASVSPDEADLSEQERQDVREMEKRDRAVRTHEQAHLSAAGGLASGGASYQKTRGPDGNMYAVGGEVQIDTAKESTPEATITKAQRVKSAALAPAQPSGQDRQVAAQASQMEAEARQEKTAEARENRETGGADTDVDTAKGTDATASAEGAANDNAGSASSPTERGLVRRADNAYRRQEDISRFIGNSTGRLSFAV